MTAQNVFAVINTWSNEVLAEATHFQAASKIEDELIGRWYAEFVGPFWHTVSGPISICRIEALGRFYPGITPLTGTMT